MNYAMNFVVGSASLLGFVGYGIHNYLPRSWRVSGISMEPTLHDRDRVIGTSRASRKFFGIDPKLGDIVIAEVGRDNLVKTISGVPGDTIFNNGLPIYLRDSKNDSKDEFWLSGDNELVWSNGTPLSVDSREFGPVQRSKIKAKVFKIYPYQIE